MSKYSTQRIAIIGMAGAGKTSYVRKFMKSYPLVFIYDPSEEFSTIPYLGKRLRKYQRIRETDFEKLLRILRNEKIRDIKKLLILDDADELLSSRDNDSVILHLFRYSRNYNLDIIYTVKRLAWLNTNIRHNTSKLLIFKYNRLFQDELTQTWKLPKWVAQKAVNLKTGEFIELTL